VIAILYTDSDKVLGAAGLTSDDVSDAFITARDLPRILSVELFTWLPTHADVYVPDGTSGVTAQGQNNSDCLVLWCTYFAAARLLDAMLLIKQRETDGKNAFDRFTPVDFQKLADAARTQAGVYRQALQVAVAAADVAAPIVPLSVVAPSYDPVTG